MLCYLKIEIIVAHMNISTEQIVANNDGFDENGLGSFETNSAGEIIWLKGGHTKRIAFLLGFTLGPTDPGELTDALNDERLYLASSV